MSIKGFTFEKRVTLGSVINLVVVICGITYAVAQRDHDLAALKDVQNGQVARIAKMEDSLNAVQRATSANDEAFRWIKDNLKQMQEDLRDLRNRKP